MDTFLDVDTFEHIQESRQYYTLVHIEHGMIHNTCNY